MIAELIFRMLIAHAVADFALQSTDMAKGKNRNRKPENIPPGQKYTPCWPYWMASHSLIHGGAIYIATGSLTCGIIETVAHAAIDFAKCENWTGPHIDQFLHLLCKAAYIPIIIYGG